MSIYQAASTMVLDLVPHTVPAMGIAEASAGNTVPITTLPAHASSSEIAFFMSCVRCSWKRIYALIRLIALFGVDWLTTLLWYLIDWLEALLRLLFGLLKLLAEANVFLPARSL
ncbi:hypothetical protein A8144_06600 [Mycobacterium leprae 3125609]|uniref:Uncharacterized protein n=3 Tax=Mycobacterium leprae TaxID=1769 RepID=O33069_MYCLR|nr:hypothetical protein [Mycobacterium leprae]OAR21357.1 hypothetical protein A8144_06600 [Mycobacterium leprae 3125609]OAX71505.1 hypothetical protein A3216_05265 [Mycobacterium leprae 7935681]CAB16690.1 hypothetical protein MLCB57.50 [Mycobacterium leprae]